MKRFLRYSLPALLCLILALSALAASAGSYGYVNYEQVRLRKQMESTDYIILLNTGDPVEILNTHSYEGVEYYFVTCHNPSHPERQYWGYIAKRYVTEGVAAQAQARESAPAATVTETANAQVYDASAYAVSPASVPAQTAQTASTVSGSAGNIRFTARGVNLRKRPSAEAKVLGRFEKDQVTAYYGTTVAEGHTWYQVSDGVNTGYVMGDYVKIVSGASDTQTAAQQIVVQDTAAYANAAPTTNTAASTVTVEQGSVALTTMKKVIVRAEGRAKGTQVKLLNSAQQVCTLLGPTTTADGYTWYNVQVKGVTGWIRGDLLRILSAAESAAYLQSGSDISASSGSAATGGTLYKPELADWINSDIQQIFYKGCIATVTDVKTGISFQVKRWSGGSHADVEPLTAADTAAICSIYGVSKSSDITEKKNYQRRSILVTVAGHSYAASMYGVPHNASEGDTIANNNFAGQFCIHFTNSSTHGSKKVDADHQTAVLNAYNNAVKLLTEKGYTFQ